MSTTLRNEITDQNEISISNYSADSKRQGFYVIGTGLMRTGTTSLKMALEKIYQRECLHMTTFWTKPNSIKGWIQAFTCRKSKAEWKELLQNYCATLDVPSIVFYAEIFEIFPDSKLILTVRDPQRWAESIRLTIKKHLDFSKRWYSRVIYFFNGYWDMPYLTECSIKSTLGTNIDWNNADDLIQRYNSWLERVIASVPKDKLLIFNVNEGWKPLCEFLNISEPNIPFPKVNDRNSFEKKLYEHQKNIRQQLLLIFFVFIVILVLSLVKCIFL